MGKKVPATVVAGAGVTGKENVSKKNFA